MMGTSLPSQDRFATTRWSTVIRNATADASDAGDALAELARRFCYPVYAYVRRCGHAPVIAGEITGLFLREIGTQAGDTQAQRHFRRYLLGRLNSFLGGNWQRIEKSVSVAPFVVPPDLEARYLHDAADAESPEQAYQCAFALEVLARALARLQAEAEQTGHLAMYQALQAYLAQEPPAGELTAIGEVLKMPPLALVVALKRLRQRFRELAARELADTVSSGSDLTLEQGTLHGILSKAP